MKKVLLMLMAILLVLPTAVGAQNLTEDLAGRILLQVERNGEAWYVNPVDLERYFMGRPADAFELMRTHGLGVTNADLAGIPMGYVPLSGTDSDGDGLSDIFEDSQGTAINNPDSDGDGFYDREEIIDNYSPLSPVRTKNRVNTALRDRLAGRILIQVEDHGEAWYLNPVDGKRYFLGRPADAFEIMRQFGLGITNANLDLVTPTDALTTYSDPLFSIDYPQYWDVNDPAVRVTGSFFAAYPDYRVMLSDSTYKNMIDVQTIQTDLGLSFQDRVDIMRERYTTYEDTVSILEDTAITVDGHDAWKIRAVQQSDVLIASDLKEDTTIIVAVAPGKFLAISAAIERSSTSAADNENFERMLETLEINEANWIDYELHRSSAMARDYSYDPILPKKEAYEAAPNYIELDNRFSVLLPANWDIEALDLTETNQWIRELIDEIIDSATDEDWQNLADQLGMTVPEVQNYFSIIKELTFTDLVIMDNGSMNMEAFTLLTRVILDNPELIDEAVGLDSLLAVTILNETGIEATQRYSKNLMIDGFPATQEEVLVTDIDAQESIVIVSTQVLLPGDVVYSISFYTELANYDTAIIEHNAMLNSLNLVK